MLFLSKYNYQNAAYVSHVFAKIATLGKQFDDITS